MFANREKIKPYITVRDTPLDKIMNHLILETWLTCVCLDVTVVTNILLQGEPGQVEVPGDLHRLLGLPLVLQVISRPAVWTKTAIKKSGWKKTLSVNESEWSQQDDNDRGCYCDVWPWQGDISDIQTLVLAVNVNQRLICNPVTGLCLLLKVDYVKAFILCQLIAAGCILTTLQPSHQIKTDDIAAQAAGDAGQVTKENNLKI